MARILITGSTDGIGLAAAQHLSKTGKHEIYLHARNASRASHVESLLPSAAGILTGDLGNLKEVKALAKQVSDIGKFDAIVYNAGLGPSAPYKTTDEGVALTFAVNVLAPYVLTALIHPPPNRILYLSSELHRSGDATLEDVTWRARGEGKYAPMQAYSDTKFHDVLLAKAVARRWEKRGVLSAAMDPGWVKTKMGGQGAPGQVEAPAKTLAEFASGEMKSVKGGDYVRVSGVERPKSEAEDVGRQDKLIAVLEDLSGVKIE